MNELIDLEATNGECIAVLKHERRIKLICIEEIGDEFVRGELHSSTWIRTDDKPFWYMVKKAADNLAASLPEVDEDVKKDLNKISEHLSILLMHVEKHKK